MATLFLETPDATQALQFWGGSSGSVTYDATTARISGLASWKCDSGAGNAAASVYKNAGFHTRLTFYLRLADLSGSTVQIWRNNAIAASRPNLRITSGGVLQLYVEDTQKGSNGSTLSVDTNYRICIALDAPTDAQIKVYLDGVEDIDSGAASGGARDGTSFFGWIEAPGANKVLNICHVYIDDDDSGDDVGDIRVTAKLPGAVNNDNYDDADGTGAINERPIDEANCKHHDAKSAVLQDYTLEIASAGDVDISGDTLVARCAWMWSVHSKDADTYFIVDNGDSTSNSWSNQEAATLNSVITDSASYPSNAAGIGQKSGAAAPDDYLYECGTLIAYLVVTGETFNRSCTVTVTVPSQSLARVATLGRSPTRTGSVVLSLGREGDFSRAPSRTGSVSPSLAKSVAHPRAISRVGNVATSLARTLTNLRGVTRTGSVVILLARTVTVARTVTRTGSVSLSVVAVELKERAVTRVGSAATSLARSLTNLRGVTRTGSVATVLAKAVTFPRAVTRTGSVVVSVAKSVLNIRALTWTGSVATALDAIATIGRQVTRVGSVATSLVRSGTFSRTVTRTGSVATSVARELISAAVEFFTGMYRRIIG